VRIAISGGGPAGLFLAALLRRDDAGRDVVVFDRNPAGATYGFGVVFSERTLEYLQHGDAETGRRILAESVQWDDIELRLEGRRLRCGGHQFSAISRRDLLRVLQDRAAELGADLRFEREATPAELDGFDLLVVAEGAQSATRTPPRTGRRSTRARRATSGSAPRCLSTRSR